MNKFQLIIDGIPCVPPYPLTKKQITRLEAGTISPATARRWQRKLRDYIRQLDLIQNYPGPIYVLGNPENQDSTPDDFGFNQ